VSISLKLPLKEPKVQYKSVTRIDTNCGM